MNIACCYLSHNHIKGMAKHLLAAGARLIMVYDPDEKKVEKFLSNFPGTPVASSYEEVLSNSDVDIVLLASVNSQRADHAIAAMENGKHVFVDKPACTTLEDLERIKEAQRRNSRRFGVYYSEHITLDSAIRAGELVQEGRIGKVVEVEILAPHKLNANIREPWFFSKKESGGILTDIGSHQVEQLLFYTGSKDAEIVSSGVANFKNPEHPDFEDYGYLTLKLKDGAIGHMRVDWYTPGTFPSYGDGRVMILGTDGYMEIRKNHDISTGEKDSLYLVTEEGVHHEVCTGKVERSFFRKFLSDCENGTETAMEQDYIYKVMEIVLKAESEADVEDK